MASRTSFAIDATFRALDKFSAPIARMTTKMDRLTRRMRKGMRGMGKMTKRVARNMRSMSLTLGSLAVIGGYALKSMIEPAAKFQEAMSGIDAVTLGSIENMDALRSKALHLGRTTIYTATQVANAMEIMGRAGLDENSIKGGISPILNAAAAEGASIDATAKVIISTMKAFDEEFTLENTTRFADVFAKVSASAKTNIIELGEGLSKVAPVAHQFGLNWEEMAAAVATLQDVGVEASMSGTQLKTMLNKLSDLTPKAAKGFKKLGIEIGDGNGNMKAMPDLLAALFEGLQNTKGNMEKVRAIARAVGLRGAMAANILTTSWGKAKNGINDLREAIKSADGAAEEMNRRRQDNLMGDFRKLKSAWEGFRIDMVSESLPELRRVVQDLTKWLQDPANIQAAADSFNTAIVDLRAFWNTNGSTIKEMAVTALNTAVLIYEAVKILYKIGDAFKPDNMTERLIGTDVDEKTAREHARYEATGELPSGAQEMTTIKHNGVNYDVPKLSGIIHVTTDDGVSARVEKQFDSNQITMENFGGP